MTREFKRERPWDRLAAAINRTRGRVPFRKVMGAHLDAVREIAIAEGCELDEAADRHIARGCKLPE